VSDLSEAEPRWRSRTVSIMWTVMIVFIILTSLTLAHLLQPFSQEALYTAFGLVWALACTFVLFGSAGLEPPPNAARTFRHSADNPRVAFQLLAANRSARQFFVFMLVVLISIYAQDVVLEPFGARALQMPVSVTARLTSIWGVGLLITLLLGAPLTRRFGKKQGVTVGALVAALAFGLIILSGVLHDQRLFMGSIFLVGLGCGLLTVSSLSFMLDMTVPQAAGLYMGAWGVANFIGRALGNLTSGLVSDLVQRATSDAVLGYMAVFVMEALGMLLAIWLLRSISVEAFRRDAEVRLHDVLALAGD
jgi:MFS transporter, BCD family, chlorophyll transporter